MNVDIATLDFLISDPSTGYELENTADKFMLAYKLSLNHIYPILRNIRNVNIAEYITGDKYGY